MGICINLELSNSFLEKHWRMLPSHSSPSSRKTAGSRGQSRKLKGCRKIMSIERLRIFLIETRVSIVWIGLSILIGCLLPLPWLGNDCTNDSVSGSSGSSKVQVNFFGESKCPDCRRMVLDVLSPLFENEISDLFELRYIAYGNVEGTPGGVITCQHGEEECLFNRYINCAQSSMHGGDEDQQAWFPYVKCLAENMSGMEKVADECAKKAGFSAKAIHDCANGAAGQELEKKAGIETQELVPKHNFVPWITVNDEAIGSDFENLDRYVCVVTPNAKRPKSCLELPRDLGHQ